jgi:uncharacterized protein YbcV (DUF1398 family)
VSKDKKYITVKQQQMYKEDCRAFNKRMKQNFMHEMVLTVDEYIRYVRTENKPVIVQSGKPLTQQIQKRETRKVPSYKPKELVNATVNETKQYTGDRKLLGIATMHKSNLVPIFDDDDGKKQAIEISKMRRN